MSSRTSGAVCDLLGSSVDGSLPAAGVGEAHRFDLPNLRRPPRPSLIRPSNSGAPSQASSPVSNDRRRAMSLGVVQPAAAADPTDLVTYSKAAEARCRALGLTMVEDQERIAEIASPNLEVTRPG